MVSIETFIVCHWVFLSLKFQLINYWAISNICVLQIRLIKKSYLILFLCKPISWKLINLSKIFSRSSLFLINFYTTFFPKLQFFEEKNTWIKGSAVFSSLKKWSWKVIVGSAVFLISFLKFNLIYQQICVVFFFNFNLRSDFDCVFFFIHVFSLPQA